MHVTFVRSTNLDIWHWPQLRAMKCGGNQPFLDFLARHPSAGSGQSASVKEKYSSRAAQLYKEELTRKMQEDERLYGKDRVVVEGAAVPSDDAAAAATAAGGGGGDFFDTWDSPPSSTASPATSTTPAIRTPPVLGLGGGASGSRPATPGGTLLSTSPATAATSAPRTVTSSSLRTTTSGSATAGTSSRPRTLGATRTNSSSLSTGTGGAAASSPNLGASGSAPPVRASKLGAGKLGVKKGGAINFEEAERKAREEEERIKRLGYDRRKEEEEQAAAAAAASSAASRSASGANGSRAGAGGGAPSRLAAQAAALEAKKDSGEMERLGMGVRKLGFGQVMGVGGEQAAKEAAARKKAAERAASGYVEPGESASRLVTFAGVLSAWKTLVMTVFGVVADPQLDIGAEETDYARKTFGNQKGISSDMYHQTGNWDSNATREAQTRLQGFQGASAISSKYVAAISVLTIAITSRLAGEVQRG